MKQVTEAHLLDGRIQSRHARLPDHGLPIDLLLELLLELLVGLRHGAATIDERRPNRVGSYIAWA